ncbi:protein disulfide-isomerase Mpd1p [[Candida] railenensis]|uniref:Protein disulfide-isomerase Mpd1p n=1 Tax=[Candida] railenensis TaxID=45579 RepID=A0A9P0VZT7_9ASCO|nr:protein disulfide-isomerase Mpd1p [[Candida] railenensis]
MKLILLFYLLVSLVVAEGDYVQDQYVYELTPSNFDKVVLKTNYTSIVKFYAPWCGYCKQLQPTFSKLGKFIHGEGKYATNVVAVNCDREVNKPLCAKYQVSGFPTVMVFRPPKYEDNDPKASSKSNRHASEVYNGERSLKAIWTFLQSRIKNYVKKFQSVSSEALKNWVEDSSIGFKKVIILTESTKATGPMLKSLAIDFLSSYRFASVISKTGGVTTGSEPSFTVNGKSVSIPEGLALPALLVLDENSGSFKTLEIGNKKVDNIKISEWLVEQNNGVKPTEGPLSKKEQKYYYKYRTGKKPKQEQEAHDEL